MPLPAATAEFRAAQERRVAALLRALGVEWSRVSAAAPWRSWSQVESRVLALVAAAMVGAARDGAVSVPASLAQAGFDVSPAVEVNASAFARSAADGRDLRSLLRFAPYRVDAAVGSPAQRLAAGASFLALAAHEQVVGAGLGASQTAITATPGAGWVRLANPPCCQDCAVLAGKWFKWNAGFKRHPGDDCIHRPAHEQEPPSGYAQDIGADQIKDLTAGQRAALDEGAELGRVVNAYRREVPGRRGRMLTTTERAGRGQRRLTPDGIVAQARTRDEAIEMLRSHGYLM